jgi:PAS domain S-box-containing protein
LTGHLILIVILANRRLKIANELTEKLRRTAESSQQSLAKAQAIAHLGSWEWDIENNILKWSDEIYRIFGTKPQTFIATYEHFISFIHPDDQAHVKEAVDASLADPDCQYSMDHRVIRPDKTERVVHERADVIWNEFGQPIRMIGTVQDITDRKHIEEELQIAKILADQANRAKSNFLATMSHEIRTPMNAIQGTVELLHRSNLQKNQIKMVETIATSNKALLHLLDDILDLSKIEDDKIEIEVCQFNLHILMTNLMEVSIPKANEKNIEIDLTICYVPHKSGPFVSTWIG